MIKLDPDAELLLRIARGDQLAIRQLVARKLPRILALGMRMLNNHSEAEDVAQETFVRVWKQAESWQSGVAKFDTWLHRVAINLCYDRLRVRENYSKDDAPELIDTALIPEQHLDKSQQGNLITAALAVLPNRQREALVLQYYQEFSNIEAADLMGVSLDALESLLSRARRNMRALLIEKRSEQAMNAEQFITLTEAYGADITCWPAAYRQEASEIIALNLPAVNHALKYAGDLDSVLGHKLKISDIQTNSRLFERIVANAPQPQISLTQHWPWRWLELFSLAGAGFAGIVAGIFCVSIWLSGTMPASTDGAGSLANSMTEYIYDGQDWS